jgi:uncharacterized protein YndB with AHSA1/START domain
MAQHETTRIQWRLHLASPRQTVYDMLATPEGRARFWAESAGEQNGMIDFRFPNGETWQSKILERMPPNRFRLRYYGGSLVTFALSDDGSGSTDLLLTDEGVPPEHHAEVLAGWVSVLLALKAAVDFGVDLRGHDPARTWDQGYVDN